MKVTPEDQERIDEFNERRNGRTLDAIGHGRASRAQAFANEMRDKYGAQVAWKDGIPRIVLPVSIGKASS